MDDIHHYHDTVSVRIVILMIIYKWLQLSCNYILMSVIIIMTQY
jgi:hypothetical protein